MKFKVDGREVSAERMRVGESCEAEKALGLDITQGASAAIAVALFVALRRDQPTKPADMIADEVMRVELESLAVDEGDAGPPAVENGQADLTSLPITGTPV